MSRALINLGAIAAGAGLVYYYDPVSGRRRRSLLRDQLYGGMRQLQCDLDKAARDMRQRLQGFVAEARSAAKSQDAPDEVLAERVRSKMGRYVSHPSAIDVEAHDGRVVLCGPILADEVQPLINAIREVPGVNSIDNQLDVRRTPGNISALQGGRTPPGERWNVVEQNWAPATRLTASVAGGTLIAFGLTQRFPVACLLGAAGLGLCAAACTKGGAQRSNQPRSSGQLRQTGSTSEAAETPGFAAQR